MKRKSIVRTVISVIGAMVLLVQTGFAAGAERSASDVWSVTGIASPLIQQILELSGTVGEVDVFGIEPVSEKKPERDTTLILTDPTTPQRFYLGQNTPNPYRGATEITYGLPAPTWVRITIHSMLGSEIMTLVNEPQKGGVYAVQFSEPDLKPGIYFYRIQTDYGVLTRRMTVAR